MRPPLAVLCLLCALAACAHKAPPRERLVAAVMPFSCAASEAEHAEEAKGLADALTVALVRSGRLRLVERDRVDALLSEARFDLSGAVDSARAAQIGKQLGAAAVVLGSITSVALREEASSGDFSGKSKRTVDVEIQARLVDVQTGELLAAGRATGNLKIYFNAAAGRATGSAKSVEKHAISGDPGQLAEPPALVLKALQGLPDKLAKDLLKTLR